MTLLLVLACVHPDPKDSSAPATVDTDITPTPTDSTDPTDTGTDTNTDTVTVPPDPDADTDGYPASLDCDDTNAAVYPGAAEVCNGVDDDCDGLADEDLPTDPLPRWRRRRLQRRRGGVDGCPSPTATARARATATTPTPPPGRAPTTRPRRRGPGLRRGGRVRPRT